jgi:hypothetical protein
MEYLVKSLTKSGSGWSVVGQKVVSTSAEGKSAVDNAKQIQLTGLTNEEVQGVEPEVTIITVK